MSVPFGGSQPAAQHQHSAGVPGTGTNLGFILTLVAAALSLVVYACSFSDDAVGVANGLVLPLLLAGGLLAGASLLPRAPRTLLPATVLAALGALILLLGVIKDEGSTAAIVVVILIAALLEVAACAVALLSEHGVIKLTPRSAGYPATSAPPGGWSPQSGPFQQPGYGAGPGYGQQGPAPYGGQPYGAQPYGGSPGAVGAGQAGSAGGQHAESRPAPQFGQQPYGQGSYGGQQGSSAGGYGGGTS